MGLLSAWWVAPENGAAVVLLGIGVDATRGARPRSSRRPARVQALLLGGVDTYSGGRSMEFGWGAEADVGAAVSFV